MRHTIAKLWIWFVCVAFCLMSWLFAYVVVKEALAGDGFAQFICLFFGVVVCMFTTFWAREEV